MSHQPLGELRKEHDRYVIRYERVFNHSISRVWDAITNPQKMAIWFMDVEMELAPGAKMTMTFPDEARTKTYGKIVTVEPEHLFEYLWLNDEGPDEFARWELRKIDDITTHLTFTYSRVEEKYIKGVPAGWHIMLDHLAETLDGLEKPHPESEYREETEKLKELYNTSIQSKNLKI